jgi:hypothetical protein
MFGKLKSSPLWVGIIGGTIATLAANLIWDIHWLEYVLKFRNWILGILNGRIPIWIILSCLLVGFILFRIRRNIIKKVDTPPEFLNYRQDKFKSWTWKWEYTKSNNGRWDVTELRPYCPSCNTLMQYSSSHRGSSASCPQCAFVADSEPLMRGYTPNFEEKSKIHLLIINEIEKKF